MREFIESLVKMIVDKPDEVEVTEKIGSHTIICELKVGDGDMGKVIGKHGNMASSLRMLIAAVSAKEQKHTVFEIIDRKIH